MKRWQNLLWLAVVASALAVASARAQMPAVTHYTWQKGFIIPVRLDDRARSQLRALQLYVRNGAGQPWVRAESAAPSTKQFTFRAPGDGEYWFSIVAVDNAGRTLPRDVQREPPEVVVVVDTKPPEFDLRLLTLEDGTVVLNCDVFDTNPDLAKIRVEYSVGWNTWKPLEVEPRVSGCFRGEPKTLGGQLRVTVMDRAGNTTTRAVTMAGAKPFSVVNSSALLAASARRLAANEPLSEQAKVQHVRNKHVLLAYEVDGQAKWDVRKIEAWFSPDGGRNWQRGGEDTKSQGPIEFDLPGEGVFGVSLAVTNNAGYGGMAPASGDAPDWWVEVDLTPPAVKLLGVRPGNNPAEPGTYIITWSAGDKNLAPTPISLYYALTQNGPWSPIAKGLANTGSYAWAVPPGLRGVLFLRLEATDLAGNVAHCEMTAGVQVDVLKPKVRVIGVVEPARQ